MSNVFKFPYDASRRVYSKMPRKSKNGTPEERAAKTAANLPPPAEVVPLSLHVVDPPHEEEALDRRKLRGNPLRGMIATVSFGATVVGKLHTAGLKGERLDAIDPEIREEWLQTLDSAIDAVATVAIGIEQAMETLKALQAREANVLTPAEFEEAYSQLDPDDQARIQQLMISRKSENSNSAVNLPENASGQPVLNLAE